uniref:Uncharacterized protein n=1 Tax=Anguilla anguilla TaxID=7936 RepID=A0A0E9PGR0_ANGAN
MWHARGFGNINKQALQQSSSRISPQQSTTGMGFLKNLSFALG